MHTNHYHVIADCKLIAGCFDMHNMTKVQSRLISYYTHHSSPMHFYSS
jgi:hypothetical protein